MGKMQLSFISMDILDICTILQNRNKIKHWKCVRKVFMETAVWIYLTWTGKSIRYTHPHLTFLTWLQMNLIPSCFSLFLFLSVFYFLFSATFLWSSCPLSAAALLSQIRLLHSAPHLPPAASLPSALCQVFLLSSSLRSEESCKWCFVLEASSLVSASLC